jgi:hypothetical protein
MGCQKVQYCSEKCQHAHWKRHIFDCKRDPSKPILTAYYLYLAVIRDQFPQDPDTLRDYGFDNVETPEDKSKLLGLYIGIFLSRGVEPIDVHRWRKKGTLVQEIINAFERESKYTKGSYYPWFLQNQHLLDPSWSPEDREISRILETWRWVGGSASDTHQQHRDIFDNWDTQRQECFIFYHILRCGWHPSPDMRICVSFGFATCRGEWGERSLAAAYNAVILGGGCNSSWTSFAKHSKKNNMLALFRRYGQKDQVISMPYMKDLFEDSMTKSVWDLKAYVYQELKPTEMVPSFRVDYGIVNCAGFITHLQLLKDTYKQVFEHLQGDPLELHRACITGNIYEYVSGLLKIKKKEGKVLRRLMKNMYPLPDFEE